MDLLPDFHLGYLAGLSRSMAGWSHFRQSYPRNCRKPTYRLVSQGGREFQCLPRSSSRESQVEPMDRRWGEDVMARRIGWLDAESF